MIFVLNKLDALYIYIYGQTRSHYPARLRARVIMPFIERINVRYMLLGIYMREVVKNSSLFLSVVGAYVVKTSSLNDKLLSN